MEQKHIDDLDESFLGEEFIDEEDVLTAVEASESPAQRRKNEVERKEKMQKPEKRQKFVQKDKKAKTAVPKISKTVFSSKKEKEVPEITITPAKQSLSKVSKETTIKESKTHLEFAAPPVDPWKEEKENTENTESSWVGDASTWKAITGIVVVLLVLSVFTQGFRFSPKEGGSLTLQEAQEKTLNFVNSYLLRPPFTAEVQSTEEVDGLYKVKLSVAGEVVDSYLTRDGKLFFPQGFAVAEVANNNNNTDNAAAKNGDTEDTNNENAPIEDKEKVSGDEVKVSGSSEVVAEDVVEEPENTQPAAEATAVSLSAKKWLFSPTKVVIPVGKPVTVTITPADELSFTFAIPNLGVEQEVNGQTAVTFTPEKTGSFEFFCSSCEDWRGMKGTLVVVE